MEECYWVKENVLAGRCGPHRVPWNLRRMKSEGIAGIVSLDVPINSFLLSMDLAWERIKHLRAPMDRNVIYDEKLKDSYFHQISKIIEFIEKIRARGKATVVHCYSGTDRTGSVLACYLVQSEGVSAEEAIARVRQSNSEALTKESFVAIVSEFAQRRSALAPSPRAPIAPVR